MCALWSPPGSGAAAEAADGAASARQQRARMTYRWGIFDLVSTSRVIDRRRHVGGLSRSSTHSSAGLEAGRTDRSAVIPGETRLLRSEVKGSYDRRGRRATIAPGVREARPSPGPT